MTPTSNENSTTATRRRVLQVAVATAGGLTAASYVEAEPAVDRDPERLRIDLWPGDRPERAEGRLAVRLAGWRHAHERYQRQLWLQRQLWPNGSSGSSGRTAAAAPAAPE